MNTIKSKFKFKCVIPILIKHPQLIQIQYWLRHWQAAAAQSERGDLVPELDVHAGSRGLLSGLDHGIHEHVRGLFAFTERLTHPRLPQWMHTTSSLLPLRYLAGYVDVANTACAAKLTQLPRT